MYKVQFQDGDWQDDEAYHTLDEAKARMAKGVKADPSGPWRIVAPDGEIVGSWQ